MREGRHDPGVRPRKRRSLLRRNGRGPEPALRIKDVWHEVEDGPTILRGISLELRPGRAGRAHGPQRRREEHAASPRQGARRAHARERRAGGRGRAAAPEPRRLPRPRARRRGRRCRRRGRRRARGREEANPRDLSGGERQRLALEVVLAADALDAVVLLDEPTSGMDRLHKDALAARIEQLAEQGAAVMVATHDTEFAASLGEPDRPARPGRRDRRRRPRARSSAAAATSRRRSRGSRTERHCSRRREPRLLRERLRAAPSRVRRRLGRE